MSTLTLRISDAVKSAKVVLAGAQEDKITPVLRCAVWEVEPQRLVSTDRYVAIAYHLPESQYEPRHARDKYEGDDEPDEVAIPRELLLWVSKQKLEHDRHIRYSMQATTVTAELIDSQDKVYGTSVERRIIGNFPPISRLHDAWTPAVDASPLHLDPALVKRVLTPLVSLFSKGEPVRFELGTYGNDRSYKSAPIRIALGTTVSILVQPAMVRS